MTVHTGATLGDVINKDRPIFAWCSACRHCKRLDQYALISKYRPTIRVQEVAARLRCSECGARKAQILDFNPNTLPPAGMMHNSEAEMKANKKWKRG